MRGPRSKAEELRALRERAQARRGPDVVSPEKKDRPAMKDLTHVAPIEDVTDDTETGDWVRIRRRTRSKPAPETGTQGEARAARRPMSRPVAPEVTPDTAADSPKAMKPMRRMSRPVEADAADAAPEPVAPTPRRTLSRPVQPEAPAQGEDDRDPAPMAVIPQGQPFAPPAPREPVTGQGDAWNSLARIRGARGLTALAVSADIYDAEPLTQGFDLLRTRLMQTMRANGWRKVAIATPRHGGGATFTAVNLALSLAKVPGSRTVLMDLNQRKPGVAAALGLRQTGGIHEFLSGEVALEDHLVRASDTLVLGMTDAPFAQSAEVFHDPTAELVLEDMYDALNPDLVIYDLPPALLYDDLAAVMPLVDGVLLVSDGTDTTAEDIAACERILESQVPLLGVVLNRARVPEHRNKWF